MAPLMTFIAMIKGWHAVAVLSFTLIFIAVTDDRASPMAERFKDAVFAFVGVPIMLFATAFLAFAFYSRPYSAGQLFPSVLLVIFAFVAIALIGAKLNDPQIPAAVVIPMGAILTLLMSGLVVGMRSVFQKFGG